MAELLAKTSVRTVADPIPAPGPVSTWSDREKLAQAMRRSLPRLGPEAREEIEKLLHPETLAIVAGVLTVWVGSHFVGIGQVVDIVLVAAGIFAIGMAVFDGIGELSAFATTALSARREADLDRAGVHFANAVSILGVQAVLAVLFRGAPKTFRGGRPNVGTPPAAGALKPTLRSTRSLPAGAGETTWWGNIVISRLGTASDRRLAALHESVHRMLTPRLEVLRHFRVQNRASSYTRSALLKYIEEALAESVAQVGVNGFRQVFKGISFPIRGRYVTIWRPDRVLTPWGTEVILPIAPEAMGVFAGAILVGGMRFEIYTSNTEQAEPLR